MESTSITRTGDGASSGRVMSAPLIPPGSVGRKSGPTSVVIAMR